MSERGMKWGFRPVASVPIPSCGSADQPVRQVCILISRTFLFLFGAWLPYVRLLLKDVVQVRLKWQNSRPRTCVYKLLLSLRRRWRRGSRVTLIWMIWQSGVLRKMAETALLWRPVVRTCQVRCLLPSLTRLNVVTGSTDILASAVRMLRLSDEGLTWLLPSFLGQWQIHFGYVYITRPYNIFLYLFIMLSPINISLNVFLLVAFLFASVEIASKPLNKIICTYRKIRWVTVGPLQWYCWTPIEYDTLPKFNVAPEKLPSQ